ncbi:hypothetical protein [Kitasatospora sp. NPDC085464]|uniref:hypothetical protein n=1 Tax=Kitasatospora sp. NPDC085464 TaxID=3364063 RepID=UPI0037CAC933
MSKGENPGLATVMNTDPCPKLPAHPCAARGHHGVNRPTDGTSMIVPGRTSEFMASAAAIGVDKVINFQMSDSVWQGADQFKQFTANVKAKIAALAAKYPGASHKFTAGWLEITATYKAITDAAVQLYRAGTLTDVRFNYVYAYDQPLSSRADGAAYVLGYHSVPEKMEAAHADPHEYVFAMPNSSYRYGPIGDDRPRTEWS